MQSLRSVKRPVLLSSAMTVRTSWMKNSGCSCRSQAIADRRLMTAEDTVPWCRRSRGYAPRGQLPGGLGRRGFSTGRGGGSGDSGSRPPASFADSQVRAAIEERGTSAGPDVAARRDGLRSIGHGFAGLRKKHFDFLDTRYNPLRHPFRIYYGAFAAGHGGKHPDLWEEITSHDGSRKLVQKWLQPRESPDKLPYQMESKMVVRDDQRALRFFSEEMKQLILESADTPSLQRGSAMTGAKHTAHGWLKTIAEVQQVPEQRTVSSGSHDTQAEAELARVFQDAVNRKLSQQTGEKGGRNDVLSPSRGRAERDVLRAAVCKHLLATIGPSGSWTEVQHQEINGLPTGKIVVVQKDITQADDAGVVRKTRQTASIREMGAPREEWGVPGLSTKPRSRFIESAMVGTLGLPALGFSWLMLSATLHCTVGVSPSSLGWLIAVPAAAIMMGRLLAATNAPLFVEKELGGRNRLEAATGVPFMLTYSTGAGYWHPALAQVRWVEGVQLSR